MWSLIIVLDEVVVEYGLHLVEGLQPSAAALDAKMLVEESAVPSLGDGVGLRPIEPGALCSMSTSCRNSSQEQRSWRLRNSRPLSESTASIRTLRASKVGSTSLLISWTAVTGSLLG